MSKSVIIAPSPRELREALRYAGFTGIPSPRPVTPDLAEDTLAPLVGVDKARLEIKVDKTAFTITQANARSNGALGGRDFYGVGTYQGKTCRFYLVQKDDIFTCIYLEQLKG